MRSLDQFYRYIEQRESGVPGTAEPAKGGADAPSSAVAAVPLPQARALRYVLRNGVTISVPADDLPAAAERADVAAFPKLRPATDGDPEPVPADGAAITDELPDSVRTADTERAMDAADAACWRALPDAVRALARLAEEAETAQGERRQLIERLLNPLLTLEDAARLLGVHPGTVRRWANKGALPHQRTVGQQRRFRLTDVLACRERREQDAGEGGTEPSAA